MKKKQYCQEIGVPFFCLTEDLHKWHATLLGPAKTPYEDGLYLLSFHFPSDYPFKPPTVRFLTPIYHPNVFRNGNICLDVLEDMWSPALTAAKLFYLIEELLKKPNDRDIVEDKYNWMMYRPMARAMKRQYAI